MRDVARYGAILLLIIFCVVRASEIKESSVAPAHQAVSGVVMELSTVEAEQLWQLDATRRVAMDLLRGKYPKGSFVPPSWFLTYMDRVNKSETVQDAREIFAGASSRLFHKQSGEHYDFGRECVRKAMSSDDKKPSDVCPDCDGTGKVGDGRVWTDCLSCKEEPARPVCDADDRRTAASGGGRVSRNRLFQGRILKRLFGN